MTVPVATRKAGPYTGNGVNDEFAFDFKVFAAADLRVILTEIATGAESDLVLDSDYSVALNPDQGADPGGDITYPISGSPMASTHKLTILSNMEIEQPLDITNGGGFYPEVIEGALDRAIMLLGQQAEELTRAVKVDPSSPTDPADLIGDLLDAADAAEDSAAAAAASETAAGISEDNAAASEIAAGLSETAAAASAAEAEATAAAISAEQKKQRFVAGVDFTAGSSTEVTITETPLPSSKDALTVYQDGVYQQESEWEYAAGVITFDSAIGGGVGAIEAVWTTPLGVGTPADGTVTTAKLAASLRSAFPVAQGRLTLTSATPVMTADVTAATTVYFTPYKGNVVSLYDGSKWVPTIFTELSQATTDSAKSPAAVANNSNYDVFVWNDSGTLRATRGPAWTSDTGRGTGAGTTELEILEGRYVNKIAITNGPAAQRGLYVGTIRSNGTATIDWVLGGDDTAIFLGVFNAYNDEDVGGIINTTVDSYTYQSTTVRGMNDAVTARASFINGLPRLVKAYRSQLTNASATPDAPVIGFGLNATNAFSAKSEKNYIPGSLGANAQAWLHARYEDAPLGFNYVQATEACLSATAAVTFYGDAGGATVRNLMYFSGRF